MTNDTQVYLASAGTGKTYKLAGRFLKLLFNEISASDILATTFTRKAAGEILDRVLSWVAEAPVDEEKLKELRDATGLGDKITPDLCHDLLAKLTRELDAFNVRTIDSFFVESAKVFALELGMNANWTIIEDDADQQLRIDAIVELFKTESISNLNRLVLNINEGENKRSVHDTTLELIKTGLDALRDSSPTAWEQIKPESSPASTESSCLVDELESLSTLLTQAGQLAVADKKLRADLGDFIKHRDWAGLFKYTAIANVRNGIPTYRKMTLPGEWVEFLQRLNQQAKVHLSTALASRNKAMRELLEKFDANYREIKNKRGQYVFEDFPLALSGNNVLGDTNSSSFRLSRKVDHLLLDEFQDTSVIQWRVLKPLIERVVKGLSTGQDIFCVGDGKQAIYRWRNGEPRLLEGFAERFKLKQDPLFKSYRSSQVVMEAVNKLFSKLEGNDAFYNHEKGLEAAESWVKEWPVHSAAKKELPGKVRLRQVKYAKNAAGKRRYALQRAVELAEKYHLENNGASIGIFTRGNKDISRIVKLLQDRNLPASAEGGNQLTDSQAVLAVLSLLHLADHPGDTAAGFHVATSFLATEYKLNGGVPSKNICQKISHSVREELQLHGFGPFLDRINQQGDFDNLSQWDVSRLKQLVDLGHAFDLRSSLRTSAFIKLVREKKVEVPTAATIKVMTIHKSKGLEFDVVILPELSGSIPGGKHARLLAYRPDEQDGFATVTMALSKGLLQIHPDLEKVYWAHQENLVHEQMCTLYVAMTRAKRVLEMIVPNLVDPEKPNTAKINKNIGGLLRCAFQESELTSQDEIIWKEETATPWDKGIEALPEAKPRKPLALKLKETEQRRHLPRQAPSTIADKKVTIAKLFDRSGAAARVHGILVHALFEQVEWLNDFVADDAKQRQLLKKLGGSEEQIDRAIEVFTNALSVNSIRQQLSRPVEHGGNDFEVLQEYSFRIIDTIDGEQVLLNGFIDRLVIERDAGGQVIKAMIYDFKTDQLSCLEDCAKQEEHHRLQMESYVRAVTISYGIQEDCVNWELVLSSLAELQLS